MKKIILFAAAAALLHCQPGYCENTKDIKPVAQIKGSVSDYRTEIVNIGWWDMFNDRFCQDILPRLCRRIMTLK